MKNTLDVGPVSEAFTDGGYHEAFDASNEAAAVIAHELRGQPKPHGHMLVFANEKGGVGKSTLAFQTSCYLANQGFRVATVDLDMRQRTLARAIENREAVARRLRANLPMPRSIVLRQSSTAFLTQEIQRIGSDADFVIVDAPGHDVPIARRAIAMADTLITPVNNSFIDLDLLGQFDPISGKLRHFGHFTRLVQELREIRDHRRLAPSDWIVVPNRVRKLGSKNEVGVDGALNELSTKAGFRLVNGFGERTIYRELFLLGLTLFDLKHIPEITRGQPVAKREIEGFVEDLEIMESVEPEIPHEIMAMA